MLRRLPAPLSRSLLTAALLPMLALAACAPGQDQGFEEEPPAAGAADADTGAGSAIETGAAQPVTAPPVAATPCDTETLQGLIGQAGDEAVYDRATRDAGARHYRALGPQDAATMDFREDRLNIDLDDSGRITGFRCG